MGKHKHHEEDEHEESSHEHKKHGRRGKRCGSANNWNCGAGSSGYPCGFDRVCWYGPYCSLANVAGYTYPRNFIGNTVSAGGWHFQ